MRARFAIPALVAALAATFTLALPAGASAAKFPLKVHKSGTGKGTVQCEVFGAGTAGPCASSYPAETELVLYATPGPGSVFVGWTDEYCSFYEAEPCELRIEEEAVEVTAVFGPIPEYPLTVEIAGAGKGMVECEVLGSGTAGPCASSYPEGTELVLYAISGPGSMFVEWSDEYCFGSEPCELRIEEEAVEVTAVFAPIPEYPLTVEIAGTGEGTVQCEVRGAGTAGPCAAEYPQGTELALHAVAEPGSVFLEWAGGCLNESCELAIEEAVEVTAIFKARPQVPFNLIKAGAGTGAVTCDGGTCPPTYSEGTEVTLAASAASGSTFAGWSGGGCSGTGHCVVTIAAGTTITATFDANPTPTPTSTPTPAPTPEPEREGQARASGSASVSSGKVALTLACAGGPCKGILQLTAKVRQGHKTKSLEIGKSSFSLAAGALTTLAVKLTGAAKKELARGRALKAKVDGSGVVASTVKLKPAKK